MLIGGQMVFLHELERGSLNARPTDDVDVIVNLRVDPRGLANTHATLINSGFLQDSPSPDGIAHRYRRKLATIDVLAPDNIGTRSRLSLGAGRTISVPGGTRSFERQSTIVVALATGDETSINRPTLVGALLAKSAALTEIVSLTSAERAKHLQDVDSLAQLLGIEDVETADLTGKERLSIERIASGAVLSPLAVASMQLLVQHGH
jgi:hypothetical protein